jgi:hypothetical protein
VSVGPRTVEIRRGGTATMSVSLPASASARPLVAGELVIVARGGGEVRAPWVYAARPPTGDVLQSVALRRTALVPSTNAPAILEVQAGRVLGRAEVRGFARLDLELLNARGKNLGVLVRLRDGLPGRYDFGLTGHGPAGQTLRRGRYRLRLVAVPTGGGRPSVRTIDFRIGRIRATGER